MKIVTIGHQALGLLALSLGVAIATLSFANRNADGPSILFPGGKLVTGELYSGPEPDWSFTDDVQVIELQLEDPPRSRRPSRFSRYVTGSARCR